MLHKFMFLVLIAMLALGVVFVGACGDDDDDDDDDDDYSEGTCEAYFMECQNDSADEAAQNCETYYVLDNDCANDAADDLFECTGTDCTKYDQCVAEYEETALDCL